MLRIATRQSPLALYQANLVKSVLERHYPERPVTLVPLTTKGDRLLETPLAKIGGKGLFIKELEQAMIDGKADIAVHSMKDMPASLPAGFCIGAICTRDNPFDALVSNRWQSFKDLPHGAVVGTSSLRRKCQLLHARADLNVTSLRGNVNTRLAKLDDGQFDAIILACAGLERLDMHQRISEQLPQEICLPAAAQGAIGIECLENAEDILALLQPLHDPICARQVQAERAVNQALQGSCQVPLASFATHASDNILELEARVGSEDGSILYIAHGRGNEPQDLGQKVADDLRAQGAGLILQQYSQ